ncbi:hypothetical protein F8A10_12055 [Paracoccus kondratievae]|uniref:hypothetical protein n=1 Tax=Paracoccus kondratievae TaxID=135740 RepID=UPI0012665142|nr:hypothetical protein [Paracoccus kondratievae]QFQ88244.1 hypothetical protein F8A10_12055 [Paracoccus kondratievae]
MSFVAPFALLLVGFVVAVSAGVARDTDLLSPTTPLSALLVAAVFLVLQAILWVRLGAQL